MSLGGHFCKTIQIEKGFQMKHGNTRGNCELQGSKCGPEKGGGSYWYIYIGNIIYISQMNYNESTTCQKLFCCS